MDGVGGCSGGSVTPERVFEDFLFRRYLHVDPAVVRIRDGAARLLEWALYAFDVERSNHAALMAQVDGGRVVEMPESSSDNDAFWDFTRQ